MVRGLRPQRLRLTPSLGEVQVRVLVRPRLERLHEPVDRRGDDIVVECRDDGCGFSPLLRRSATAW